MQQVQYSHGSDSLERARGRGRAAVIGEKLTEVPPGEVELLVLYAQAEAEEDTQRRFKLTPLDLGEFKGGNLSREELYDDAR